MTNRILPTSSDPIPKEYQKMQWAVVAHTIEEGGDWIESDSYPPNVYAIRHANGWIYDFGLSRLEVSPWRHFDD